ncbi:MAG: hypothetical protein M3291_07655 [Actinomycetota bacterium]|nr:hypothetical protein [Actinomycetota bacterium]
MFDEELLDDPEGLAAVDVSGLLRAAASAGAQVRSTAGAAAEAGLDRLTGERPRALVLITRPGAAAAAAPLLVALLGSSCPVPLVACEAVPSWAGALDVVLAHTTDPGDQELAVGVDRAVRRGAQVVLTAPPDGPVAATATGRSVLLAPRLDVPPGLVLPRALAAGLLLLDALGLLRVDLDALAGELDREAERCHPGHESFVNPAKSLTLRMAGLTPLLWGTDPVATAVARHAAASLAAHAGVVAHAAGWHEAAALPVLRVAAARGSTEPDVFHDPYLAGGPAGGPPAVRPMLLSVQTDPASAAARRTAFDTLPGADPVTADEELMVAATDPAAGACAVAVLALRFDLAALYLGLGSGVLGTNAFGGGTFGGAGRFR